MKQLDMKDLECQFRLLDKANSKRDFIALSKRNTVSKRWATARMSHLEPFFAERYRLPRGAWRKAEPKRGPHGEVNGCLHHLDANGRVIRMVDFFYDAFFVFGPAYVEQTLFDPRDLAGIDRWEEESASLRRIRGLRACNRSLHEFRYEEGRLVTEHLWWAQSRDPFWKRHLVWTAQRVERYDYSYDSAGKLESITETSLDGKDAGKKWVLYRSMPKGETLKTLIARVEDGLVTEIPKVMRQAKIAKQIYCVILYYSPGNNEFPPCLALGREIDRKRLLHEKGSDAKYELWIPPQFPLMNHPGLQITEPALLADCDLLNQQLAARNDCRAAARLLNSIAKRLMEHDWRKTISVTDDFVVFALDFGEDAFSRNLKASAPQRLIESLRSRDLLP